MKKILYIVSTLKRSGPTNQLYNLIKNMDRSKFEPYVITLSPEPQDSRWGDYEGLCLNMVSLGLSRLSGLLMARSRIKSLICEMQPDLIHTQGIRADSLISSLEIGIPWVMTARNFPPEDYLGKFGKIRGGVMVRQHFAAMKKCQYLVSCSRTIQKQLAGVGVQGYAIQNGVSLSEAAKIDESLMRSYPAPIYISIGSLIPRKNMSLIIDAFQMLPKQSRGTLVILGDGPLMADLKARSCSGIRLAGNVSNVADYLANADYFVSSSLSEGLPNTVLEALAAGLPVILSDIESHKEIACESEMACKVFALKEGAGALSQQMRDAVDSFSACSVIDARRLANEVFSAQKMSARYQEFYNNILEAQ